jgi:hypothetical protein
VKALSVVVFWVLATVTSSGLAQTDPSVTKRQVAVLQEMADQGVIDAYFQLGMLAQVDAEGILFTPEQANLYLAVAASAGHTDALRSLAFALLETGQESLRGEVAVLIAQAAVLGSRQAAVDLKLLPKFTPVDPDQIVDGFGTALERLGRSQTLDCDLIDAALCPESARSLARIRPRDVFYARALIAEGPYPDLASVHQVFNDVLEGYSAFADNRTEYLERRDQANARIAVVEEEKQREAERMRTLTGSQAASANRRVQSHEAVRKYLAQQSQEDIDLYRDRIVDALQKVNQYRNASDQIRIDDLLQRQEGEP